MTIVGKTAAGHYRAFLSANTGRVLARLLKAQDTDSIRALLALEDVYKRQLQQLHLTDGGHADGGGKEGKAAGQDGLALSLIHI